VRPLNVLKFSMREESMKDSVIALALQDLLVPATAVNRSTPSGSVDFGVNRSAIIIHGIHPFGILNISHEFLGVHAILPRFIQKQSSQHARQSQAFKAGSRH
jgi:hypothetical protein